MSLATNLLTTRIPDVRVLDKPNHPTPPRRVRPAWWESASDEIVFKPGRMFQVRVNATTTDYGVVERYYTDPMGGGAMMVIVRKWGTTRRRTFPAATLRKHLVKVVR